MLQVSKPSIGDAEIAAVSRVLRSGYLGMGEETRRFEEELEAFIGGERSAVCTNTGTSALHIAFETMELGRGDEVLVPSLTYVATFQAILACGARPIPCDVRLEDGLLDLDDAAQRLGPKTKAIVPVHYAGFPGNWREVYAFAEAHSLRVVEDAAHAFGSSVGVDRIGSIGDVVCFSFDPIKSITSGEGGAILTGDPDIVSRARCLRQLGIPPRRGSSVPPASGVDGVEIEISEAGWRYHMPDLMAAIGRVQLARFEGELGPARVELARMYRERLRDVAHVRLLKSNDAVVPHIFALRVVAADRDALRERLSTAGFQTAVHYKPNHLHPLFGCESALPGAEQLYRELLSLPLHGQVTERDVDEITEAIRTADVP